MLPLVRLRYPLLPGARARASERLPRTTLAARGLTVTVEIISPNDAFSGLASDWEEDERSGKLPLLQYAGERLVKMRRRAVMGLDPNVSIERELAALRDIATSGERVVMTRPGSGTAFSLARRGGWTITDMDWRVLRRRVPDNAITRVEIDFEFTEWSPIEALNRPRSPGTLWGKLPTGGVSTAPGTVPNRTGTVADALSGISRAPTGRRHTVAAGETLSAIAARYYGTANEWPRIASANGIRDPRKLQVGQLLTIP